MATLLLTAGAKALAASLTLSNFAAAALVTGASMVGSYIDSRLFGKQVKQEGPRLDEVRFTGSSTTTAVPRVGGRFRVAGNIIWSTRFREEVSTETQSAGGKGAGPSTKTTTYKYYVSFAVGLCEGPIQDIGRIWADGKPLDLDDITVRMYFGDETQEADPKIVAVEGAAYTPAYRGLAYIVFEEFPLETFGNRIPQINVEVIGSTVDSLAAYEDKIQSVCLGPGTGEFAYGTTAVYTEGEEEDVKLYENRHTYGSATDFAQSIAKLQRSAPDCTNVILTVGWHGSDLRCGECLVRPKVEAAGGADGKVTKPYKWLVSELERADADVVTLNDESVGFYGGTPADRSIHEAITYLKAQGFSVTLMPILLMDIPEGNVLNNPYTDDVGQAIYPWRGLITLDLAPGVAGSPNKTADARSQVETFFGTCTPAHFATYGGTTNDSTEDDDVHEGIHTDVESSSTPPSGTAFNTIKYTGPNEWTYRRMILHYAKLCAGISGGVSGFIIGSELVGLNRIQDETDAFPAVDALIDLAADVRTILGSSPKVTYAADWSEWHHFVSDDDADEILFPLDALWASSHISAVAISNKFPLADWRASTNHLDSADYRDINDLDYLKSNISGGEYYDWQYADENDRDEQTRTTITDPTYSEPWVKQSKNLASWWSNAHKERPGGVRNVSSTSWVAESKPIWFVPVSCPAIQFGANQPSVEPESRSGEDLWPHYSNGARDDFMQRQLIRAHLEYWDENAGTDYNPVGMVDPANIFAGTWDIRPFPEYPARTDLWADCADWRIGTSMNGRLGVPEIGSYILQLFSLVGLTSDDIDVSKVYGLVTGFASNQSMSIRDILDPIMFTNFLQSYESEGVLHFVHKGSGTIESVDYGDLIEGSSSDTELGGPIQVERSDDLELPQEVRISFIEDTDSYDSNVAYYRNPTSSGASVSESSVNVLMDFGYAEDLCARMLQEVFVARDKVAFQMPPSMLRFDPTDMISLNVYGLEMVVTLESISDEFQRQVSATKFDPTVFVAQAALPPPKRVSTAGASQGTRIEIMNLPMLNATSTASGVYFAASGKPWGQGVAIMRSVDNSIYQLDGQILTPSIMGVTDFDLAEGPLGRWDYCNDLYVAINATGTLETISETALFQGYNSGALYNASVGEWEIVQWLTATAVGTNRYRLSGLLRGQLGSEGAMHELLPAGSRFVVLDSARIVQSTGEANLIGQTLYWKYGDAALNVDADGWRTATAPIKGLGYRPYSPCSLRARKNYGTEDITLSWKRRTRINGDVWDGGDVPLNEDIESYEVDIYDGVTVVRTLSVSGTSSVVYTQAMQITDFGSSLTTVTFEVYQLSTIFGRGEGRQTTITFPA